MSEPTHETVHVELITAEATLVSCDDGRRVYAPTAQGEIGVLPDHTSLMTPLTTGRVRILHGGRVEFYATSGGLLEVHPDRVLIVAETAELAGDIDAARAEASRKRAEQRIAGAPRDASIDLFRAQGSLARALNRLRVAEHARGATE